MVTKSETQEITVIRVSPKAVQTALEETLRKNIDVRICWNSILSLGLILSFHLTLLYS